MKRGAIQLSMNFLVTIIIALTLLALGILLLRQFVEVTVETQNELNEQTQNRIAELLNQGQQIVIPFSSQTLRRGDSHLFGVGVINIFEESTFELNAGLSGAFHPDDTPLSPEELAQAKPSEWIRLDSERFTLKKNEDQSKTLLIKVPTTAPSGIYIFNVMVYINPPSSPPYDPSALYDTVRKIVITVP